MREFGKNFPEITTREINKRLINVDFERQQMAIFLLKIAIKLSILYNREESCASRNLSSAMKLVQEKNYAELMMITKKKYQLSLKEKGDEKTELIRFFYKCIQFSSTEIQPDEHQEYFDCILWGLKTLQQKQPDILYCDIFS